MKHLTPNEEFTVRPSLSKHLYMLAGGIAFVVIGVLMIILPAESKNGFVHWNDTMEVIVGVPGVLLGLLVVGVTLYSLTLPFITLTPGGIIDHRRKFFIPFSDIRTMIVHTKTKNSPLQRIELNMFNTEKYDNIESWNKKKGFAHADVTFDLSMSTVSDFQYAQDYIRRHMKEVESSGFDVVQKIAPIE